jgi:uncharacterized protein YjdB
MEKGTAPARLARLTRAASMLAASLAFLLCQPTAATAAPAGDDSGQQTVTRPPARSAAADSLPKAPPLRNQGPSRQTSGASVCMNAHLQDIGWQGWVCADNPASATVGTTGQSRRMEALAIVTWGTSGICANAHLQDIGWQGWACGGSGEVVTVGTTGQSRRMEALALQAGVGSICANAHLQDIGWQGWTCGGYIVVGTTGQSRRMEALAVQP